MNKLLLDDEPLIVLPSLAKLIGLNESIVLQQLHYWLRKSNHSYEGYKWIYNTYEEWQEQFPFWSVRTLKRIITGLENNEFIVSGNFNKLQIDRTKWYRINYEKLNALVEHPEGQYGTSIVTNWHDGGDKLAPPLPEITSEITSEKSTTTAPKNIIVHFEDSLCRLSPKQTEFLYQWVDDFDGQADIIHEAISISDNRNKRTYGFVEYLLKEWSNNNLKSLDRVRAYEQEKFNKQKPARSGSNGKNQDAQRLADEYNLGF